MSEPRVWDLGIPPEPNDVTRLVDCDGDVWLLVGRNDEGGKWAIQRNGGAWSSWRDLMQYAPLTEAAPEVTP